MPEHTRAADAYAPPQEDRPATTAAVMAQVRKIRDRDGVPRRKAMLGDITLFTGYLAMLSGDLHTMASNRRALPAAEEALHKIEEAGRCVKSYAGISLDDHRAYLMRLVDQAEVLCTCYDKMAKLVA